MKNYIKVILRGVGQVMLQNNAIAGLLFLIGIFYNSWILGIGAIVGCIISTYFAHLLKYSKEDINNGLYGFNGVLVGIAIYFYFGLNIISFLFLIFGSVFSTFIMYKMKKIIPAFTAPFIISTWFVIIFIKIMSIIPLLSSSLPKISSLNLLSAVNMGFGQVMFQGNIITGFIFFLGVLVSSRKAALYALYASALSIFVASFLLLNISMLNIGIFSYNAILCGIALGNNKKIDYLFIALAVILSVIFTYIFGKFGLIALTAPFVITTWIVIYIKEKKLFLR